MNENDARGLTGLEEVSFRACSLQLGRIDFK